MVVVGVSRYVDSTAGTKVRSFGTNDPVSRRELTRQTVVDSVTSYRKASDRTIAEVQENNVAMRKLEYRKSRNEDTPGSVSKKIASRRLYNSSADTKESKFRRKSSPMLYLPVYICIITCLSFCEARNSRKGGTPYLLGEAKTKITAIVGETLTLPCLIDGDPFPLTTWKLNGELIEISRPRFKKHGFNLRIRDVRETDDGTYQCVATNGFGSAEVEVKLVVQAARSSEVTVPTKPRFVQPTKMRRRNLYKLVGSSLRLRCKASGYPTPQIEWYKDGNLTVPAYNGMARMQSWRPNWTYVIRMLSPNDAGQYRCRVWNDAGEIGYVYKVKVVERFPGDSPVLIEPHPMNTTVQVGGQTTIQCRVDSVMKPTIKWIKRLDQDALASYGKDLPDNIITIERKHYLILPTQDTLSLPDGSYLNKLVIQGATKQHAGMYICLGANTMGYNYKYAYLKVVSDQVMSSLQATHPTLAGHAKARPPQTKQGTLSLPGIIGAPACVGVLVVIAVAWYCQKRKYGKLPRGGTNAAASGSDRLSAMGSIDTKSSTRSSPIPQEAENTADQAAESSKIPRSEVNNNNERHRSARHNDAVYTYRHPSPPTAGTPLLTVTEPDDTDFQIKSVSDDDEYCQPTAAPPPSVAPSQAPSCYSSNGVKSNYPPVPPPPPPPSQYSASSVSSYPDTLPPQYSPHYHYIHPHSSGNSRRHHHHHHSSHSHSRGDHCGH